MEQVIRSVLLWLLGEDVSLLVYIVLAALPLVFILLFALVAVWTEMKVSAHMQDRLAYMYTGPHGIFQPIADILKLLQKEDTVPAAADKLIFTLAPFLVFIGTYAGFAALPFSSEFIGSDINLGVFYIIAASSIVVVGLMMAGWASNNKWSLFGAMRSAGQIVSYEIPTALALLVAVMITGSLNLQEVIR
ncbi:MAG TPA: complex I subunit 1 family protein, partial [Bacteroidota bacterium]